MAEMDSGTKLVLGAAAAFVSYQWLKRRSAPPTSAGSAAVAAPMAAAAIAAGAAAGGGLPIDNAPPGAPALARAVAAATSTLSALGLNVISSDAVTPSDLPTDCANYVGVLLTTASGSVEVDAFPDAASSSSCKSQFTRAQASPVGRFLVWSADPRVPVGVLAAVVQAACYPGGV